MLWDHLSARLAWMGASATSAPPGPLPHYADSHTILFTGPPLLWDHQGPASKGLGPSQAWDHPAYSRVVRRLS